MRNPLHLFSDLRDMYLRYLDSPFALRYPELAEERRSLLDTDGCIYRDPLIEPLTVYRRGGSFEDTVRRIFADSVPDDQIQEMVELVSLGLFPQQWQMFTHQQDVLEACFRQNEDVIITTGTGSGKTECFLLPITISLLVESSQWAPAPEKPRDWNWWMLREGGDRRRLPMVAQRAHETRPAAMRSLILYPMNALVEDQLGRLRMSLDSADARDWLSARRGGNRFYFGRYTGRTPVSGKRSNQGKVEQLREILQEMDRDAQFVRGTDAERFFPALDGAEMYSRWDMHDAPPDILITNYSMLNIMLMREIESPMFAQTRDWLRASADNKFYLIVDELHSYRGTPGTEVAYLLRAFLDRIGLSPESEQLRIIASSASLEDGESGRQYLQHFFSRSRDRFRLLNGDVQPPQAGALARLKTSAQHLPALRHMSESLPDTIGEFTAAVSADQREDADAPPIRLASALHAICAPDALRDACRAHDGRTRPVLATALAERVFDVLPAEERANALEGLLESINVAREPDGSAVCPLRVHYFFRNLQGLWACSNPRCSEAGRESWLPVGKLYDRPTFTCACGARVLELLYCEACGDVFLGGFRREAENPNEWYLSPDHPNLEASPDQESFERDYLNFAVYWPVQPGTTPASTNWSQDGVQREWRPAEFTPADGHVSLGGNSGYLYYVRRMHNQDPPAHVDSARRSYPSRCPRCEADWAWAAIGSPIRTMRTGFQKIAQVLGDAALRSVGDERKLVVFSDSRQDAAKLSAGMRFAHYRDVLRQAISRAMDLHRDRTAAFHAQIEGAVLTDAQSRLAAAFQQHFPEDATVLALASQDAMANRPAVGGGGRSNAEVAAQILATSRAGPYRVSQVVREAGSILLNLGINPGGYGRDVLWTSPDDQRGSWRDLYEWPEDAEPSPMASAALSAEQQNHQQNIRRAGEREALDIIFASGRRSFESLLLAYMTCNRTRIAAPSQVVQDAADSTIRLFGSRRRLSTHSPYPRQDTPGYVRAYLRAIADEHGEDPEQFIGDVLQFLIDTRCLAPQDQILRVEELFLVRPGEECFQCPQCRRVHLHGSGGICTECLGRLGAALPLVEAAADPDYYAFLAAGAGEPFRLNCEELTGQTNSSDARKRQRWFQDVCLPQPDEVALADAVDVLSVTTTMEAGVDIGALQGVMMANMPPMRFNYQQRVGRTGRRQGMPISFALTLCRGRSHDDYYFLRPERMTGDPPPQPYVDMRRVPIVRRVLAKEVLRLAFASFAPEVWQGGDNVHGEFGEAAGWVQPPPTPDGSPGNGPPVRQRVAEWIQNHPDEIERITDLLLAHTTAELRASRGDLLRYMAEELIDCVSDVANDPASPENSLSKRLANAGVLPMFGFPSRVRYLYHRRPRSGRDWPPDEIIDRDLDLAISQFAPGSESVKDGLIHTSVGAADYRRAFPTPVEVESPLGPPIPVGFCRECETVDPQPAGVVACRACGSPAGRFGMINLSQPRGFRTWFGRERDFDGSFDWTPRASYPRIGLRDLVFVPVHNAVVWCDQQQVYLINDNAGRLFEFEKLHNCNTWITREALEHVGINNPTIDQNAGTDGRALASIKQTDVLVLGINQWPVGVNAMPLGAEGVATRAALLSLGYLLRRAAADRLDIHERELKVGLRIDAEPSGNGIVGQVFLSDDLENGAGYSSLLGSAGYMSDFLRYVLGDFGESSRVFYQPFVTDVHAARCLTSCPDCLRDYSNLQFHNILDWRLGFDLARLALEEGAAIDFTPPYWSGIDERAAATYFNALPGWTRTEFAGLQAGIANGRAEVVVHPLWNTRPDFMPEPLANAYAEARAQGLEVSHKSVFEIFRRPF